MSVPRQNLDEILIGAALQADRIGLLAADELARWLESVLLSAAEQVQLLSPSIGRTLTASDLARSLELLRERLGDLQAPRQVLEALVSAQSMVTRLADAAAAQALEQVAAYRPESAPPADLVPLVTTLATTRLADWFPTIVGSDERLAELMETQIGAALLSGLGPREVSRLIAQRTSEIARHRIETIVRTEMMRHLTARQIAHYIASPGVVAWRWQATLDRRTCGVCWSLHGTLWDLEQPMLRHPNCRCVAAPVSDWQLKLQRSGARDVDPVLEELWRTGWERMLAMDDVELKRILGPTRARIVREQLAGQPDGWKALVKLVTHQNRPMMVGARTVAEVAERPATTFALPRTVPAYAAWAYRLSRASEDSVAGQVARLLGRYGELRAQGKTTAPEQLIERGRLLDQALQLHSEAYRTIVERVANKREQVMELQYMLQAGESPVLVTTLWQAILLVLKLDREEFERNGMSRAMSRDIRALLSTIRPFAPPVVPFGRVRWEGDFEDPAFSMEHRQRVSTLWGQAVSYYPASWMSRMAEVEMTVRAATRASATRDTLEINPRVGDTSMMGSLIHEMAHMIELHHPEVKEAESRFYQYRRDQLEQPNAIPMEVFGLGGPSEYALPIAPNPYTGKRYVNKNGEEIAFELLSTGMQSLMIRDHPVHLLNLSDEEFRAWLLGVLMEY